MDSKPDQPVAISLALTPGISPTILARLLALQRQEEPQTALRLREIAVGEVRPGLEQGRCNVALAVQCTQIASCAQMAEHLWQDELALALPARSPLLVHGEIGMEMLHGYALIPWQPCANHRLCEQIEGPRLADASCEVASSFELMATLVAAGLGVGIAPRSRLARARNWGIVLRAIVGGPHLLHTELIRSPNDCPAAVERFADRARRIAAGHR